MDVSKPYLDIAPAGPPPLGLQGALQSLLTKPTDWNDPQKTAFQKDVQAFINNPPASFDPAKPDPIVAPPIYGRWHAAVQSVDRTATGWVNDLNLDLRDRSAGGMGTQVVQTERTALMASAWQPSAASGTTGACHAAANLSCAVREGAAGHGNDDYVALAFKAAGQPAHYPGNGARQPSAGAHIVGKLPPRYAAATSPGHNTGHAHAVVGASRFRRTRVCAAA
jgi:hypothetical protein